MCVRVRECCKVCVRAEQGSFISDHFFAVSSFVTPTTHLRSSSSSPPQLLSVIRVRSDKIARPPSLSLTHSLSRARAVHLSPSLSLSICLSLSRPPPPSPLTSFINTSTLA